MANILDTYHTIDEPAYGEYKEKGSKFLAFAYPMDEEESMQEYLNIARAEHHKARHFCYAYQIGLSGDRYRINDDGEPSGTAGKPILGQILSFGLTNVAIIVIRYFGGTKLGVSGLIQAYREAAKAALETAHIVEKYISSVYRLQFNYDQMGHVLNVLKDLNTDILNKSFDTSCEVTISVRQSVETHTLHQLIARLLNKSMEEVSTETCVDFCTIEKIG
ncbi:MAG TPA: YigZ family protein [Saprospiraceae bacterium]|nr:YigZ family protein [Saprospiraceae bacterium]HRO09791.1 YigZ family protein [Saprospiraceae bacterium]HRP43038.1 YigZ family protein [Saprospiraceae bacterium]